MPLIRNALSSIDTWTDRECGILCLGILAEGIFKKKYPVYMKISVAQILLQEV